MSKPNVDLVPLESAPEYEYTDAIPNWKFETVHRDVMREIDRISPKRILEVGCGSGYFCEQIRNSGRPIIGIDSSSSGVSVAKKSFPNCDFRQLSAYDDLKSAVGLVDCIVAIEVIEHLQYPVRFLKQARKCLSENGSIILTTPYHGYFKNLALSVTNKWDSHFSVHWEQGHVKFFSRRSLGHVLQLSGFTPTSFRGEGRLPGLYRSMILSARVK